MKYGSGSKPGTPNIKIAGILMHPPDLIWFFFKIGVDMF